MNTFNSRSHSCSCRRSAEYRLPTEPPSEHLEAPLPAVRYRTRVPHPAPLSGPHRRSPASTPSRGDSPRSSMALRFGSGSAPVRLRVTSSGFRLFSELLHFNSPAPPSVRGARERAVQTERPTLTRAPGVKMTEDRRHLAATSRKCSQSTVEEPVPKHQQI